MTQILVVDDDAGQRSLLQTFLEGQGYRVRTAVNGRDALEQLATETPRLMISDVRMPEMDGLALLERVRVQAPDLPVLLVTAYADVRDAVGAIQGGAIDYLAKPIDLDELADFVAKVCDRDEAPPQTDAAAHPLPEHVIVESKALRNVFREVALVAPSDTRVLITGESGVGKEFVADMIHQWSPRAPRPFLKVNCAAIPENLLESELFGHEKGAFTGATNQRIGRFEEADGGTILLDEIAEMAPALQAKLLRVTQEGTFNRVGSNREFASNVRVLAATNRDLEAEVAAGRFREDLYYRLNVMEIFVPPLRDRPADVVALANHFLRVFGRGKPRFSPGALACLEKHAWPGNVRELRNAIERAVLLAGGDVILPEHFPRRVQESVNALSTRPPDAGRTMVSIERDAILDTLRACDFNRTETARQLGISRRALTYKLRDLREQGFPTEEEGGT